MVESASSVIWIRCYRFSGAQASLQAAAPAQALLGEARVAGDTDSEPDTDERLCLDTGDAGVAYATGMQCGFGRQAQVQTTSSFARLSDQRCATIISLKGIAVVLALTRMMIVPALVAAVPLGLRRPRRGRTPRCAVGADGRPRSGSPRKRGGRAIDLPLGPGQRGKKRVARPPPPPPPPPLRLRLPRARKKQPTN